FPDFVHIGAYKGAADALTRTQPTPEMRETLTAVVDQAYRTMQEAIAAARHLPPETIAKRIDDASYTADGALTAGLVDSVATYEEFRAQQTSGLPWKHVKLKDSPSGGFDAQKLQAFLGLAPPKRPSEPHIALVYALGPIVDGRGGGILGARQQIAGRTLAAAIDNLAADPAVAAIVLRVDSPGGSAMASEQIWRALQRAREGGKPVVVSMGGVAASGGYYISCGATKIFALANTLTGSIGVIGGKLAFGGALERLGVQAFPIAPGKRAAMWSAFAPWTADERQSVLHMMEEIYRVFVSRVAAGRDKTTEEVHAVAQGRVWTGAAALERGLVDELGGLYAALAEARKLTGIGPEVALEVYPPEPTLKDILEGMSEGPTLLRAALDGGQLAELAGALGLAGADVVLRALAQLETFAAEPVQTALLWPVVVR
ncbi:MAG TPA: signal peptide peptidase SppA, partial [Nannocystis sp.]